MAKNRKKRNDPGRAARAVRLRTMLVVDRVEVRSVEALVTLRASDIDSEPVSIAIPGEAVLGLLDSLGEAIHDAEEQYWRIVVPYIKGTGLTSPDDVACAMSRWHRTQGWESAAKHVPPGQVMFLLTNAGHVAIGAIPPASLKPVLAIFDPLQLRRISQGMIAAAYQTLQEPDSRPWPLRALLAHETLSAQPWCRPDTYQDPAPAEAAEYMKNQYVEYLKRSPFVRREENNLPL